MGLSHQTRNVIAGLTRNRRVAAGEGFTLAEVLITLGIIGIVAAMTLPTLIQSHRKQVVETRLKKFYSTINQAIQMAEVDYGDRTYWYNLSDVDIDKNGNSVKGRNPKEKFVYKYFVPYIKTLKVELNNSNNPIIYFPDGSSLENYHWSPANFNDWKFYTIDREQCRKKNNYDGICAFYFIYMPTCNDSYCKYIGRTFEPYKYNWNGSEQALKDDCMSSIHHYCAALIQYNNWGIPDDYPYKF